MLLTFDIETRSAKSLNQYGTDVYTRSCSILLFGYAFDDQPPEVWIPAKDQMPAVLRTAFLSSDCIKLMHNSRFDLAVVREVLGIDIPFAQCRDTRPIARRLGLPEGLGDLSNVLEFGEEAKASELGAALIKKYCSPAPKNRKYGSFVTWDGARFLDLFAPQHSGNLEDFCAYVIRDVQATRKFYRLFSPKFDLSPLERSVWLVDGKINRFGIPIDTGYLEHSIKIVSSVRSRLLRVLRDLTGVKNPNSCDQLLPWLKSRGYRFKSLDAEHVHKALEEITHGDAHRALEIKQELTHSASATKLESIKRRMYDGRLRNNYNPFATVTGRWTSTGAQTQNMARKPAVWDGTEVHVRNIIGAPDGNLLCKADFSQIELRLSAEFAGITKLIEIFRRGEDAYTVYAANKLGIAPEAATKDQRQGAKVINLAGTYGMGAERLQQVAKGMGVEWSLEQAEEEIQTFRNTYPELPEAWKQLGNAALKAVIRNQTQECFGVRIGYVPGKLLWVKLPSGRETYYLKPQLFLGQFKVPELSYLAFKGSKGITKRLWGAKIFEHVIQGIARDCLALALLRADAAGLNVCLHTHDEIVAEERETEAGSKLRLLVELMEEPMPWMPRLVLKAEGLVIKNYGGEPYSTYSRPTVIAGDPVKPISCGTAAGKTCEGKQSESTVPEASPKVSPDEVNCGGCRDVLRRREEREKRRGDAKYEQ